MNRPSSPHRDLLRRLDRAQRRHARRLRKFERATVKLQRRTGKLLASEARIARIQARLEADRVASPEAPRPQSHAAPNAWLVFNPTSGRAGEDNAVRLTHVVEALLAHGISPRVHIKTSGAEARAFAREAIPTGGMVIVAAGDGTIGDVAAELIGSRCVLGLIPIGTMNNLARSLGIPLDIDAACALLAMRTTRHIDAGRISTGEADAPEGHAVDYFFDCAGVGKLALAAAAGQAFEKGQWRGLPRALRALFGARRTNVQVELDGVVMSAATGIVTISNAPIMGNKLLCAPDAKMDDGLLDVAVYDGMGDVALSAHFLAVTDGRADPIATYRARHVRIRTADAMPTSADMRIGAKQHVIDVQVIPGAVEMVVGDGIGLTLPVAAAPKAPTFAADPPLAERGPAPDVVHMDGRA